VNTPASGASALWGAFTKSDDNGGLLVRSREGIQEEKKMAKGGRKRRARRKKTANHGKRPNA
jgi:hypothetical protein